MCVCVQLVPADFDYGTGEEATVRVISALDSLGKQLRQLKNIPLEVSAVQGTSPVFRYSDVFPPLSSSYEVSKQLETKGRTYLLLKKSGTAVVPRWIPLVDGR
jgi:U3 small nucleolar RNA-associated protein 22